MRGFDLTLIGILALAAALLLGPATAYACEPPACRGGFLVPESGTIPANAAGLVWFPLQSFFGNDEIPDFTTAQLSLLSDGQDPVGYEIEWLDDWPEILVVPDTLVEGSYRFSSPSYCESIDEWEMHVDFTVGPAAAEPTSLGEIVVDETGREAIQAATAIGSCSVEVDSAYVDLRVALSNDARPWADLLLYRTFIDYPGAAAPVLWDPRGVIGDSRAPGSSWIGRGQKRLFAQCEASEWDPEGYYGLPEGDYAIFMTAELAGTDVAVQTPSVVVRLDCAGGSGIVDPIDPDVVEPVGDAGSDAADTGFADADAGFADADAGLADGDAEADTAPDVGLEIEVGGGDDAAAGSNAAGSASGCACRGAGQESGDQTALWLCLTLLVALSLARRLGARQRR